MVTSCLLVSDAPQPVLEGASASDVVSDGGAFVVAAYVAGALEPLATAEKSAERFRPLDAEPLAI